MDDFTGKGEEGGAGSVAGGDQQNNAQETTGASSSSGGRPRGSRDKRPRVKKKKKKNKTIEVSNEGEVQFGEDEGDTLGELENAGFGDDVDAITGDGDAVEFTKEELDQLLALAFITSCNGLFRLINWNLVSIEEADRWAKCTRIVFWKYLQTMNAGLIVWVFLTVGIFATKKPLEGNANG